jgi:hypothetical protein
MISPHAEFDLTNARITLSKAMICPRSCRQATSMGPTIGATSERPTSRASIFRSKMDAWDRHQLLNAFVSQRRAGKITPDHFEILAEPIELAQMPLDGEALVLGHHLLSKPRTDLGSTQIPMRTGGYQVRMQDRLDDVLPPGTLAHDLIAAGNLPAQRLRHVIGDPHLRCQRKLSMPGANVARIMRKWPGRAPERTAREKRAITR